jgi:hypothetical protein
MSVDDIGTPMAPVYSAILSGLAVAEGAVSVRP